MLRNSAGHAASEPVGHADSCLCPCQVADFNLSRSVIEHAGISNAELNSVEWAAPEQLAGKAYGREADVYSFGVCLWSLVTLQVRKQRTPCWHMERDADPPVHPPVHPV